MKNRYISYIVAAMSVLLVTSCNNFLDTMPDNRTELDSDKKIQKLLVSAYPQATYQFFTNFMSDDYDDIGTTFSADYSRQVEDMWYWREDREEDNDSPKNAWQAHYMAIAHANQALQAIEELGNPTRLDALRGEALLCRAYNHFRLVNVFCQHFSLTRSSRDMGIPYMDHPETEVNPQYERGTVAEVYEKIEKDLLEGLPLIDDSIYDVPKYHFNKLAAYGFATEFYLYYTKPDDGINVEYNVTNDAEAGDRIVGSNLDQVIKYADLVLGSNPELMMRNVSGYDTIPMGQRGDAKFRVYVGSNNNTNLLLIANNSLVGITPAFGNRINGRFNHSELLAKTEGLLAPNSLWTTSPSETTFLLEPQRYDIAGGPFLYLRHTVPYFFEMTDQVAQTGFAHSVQIAVSADNALLCRAEAYALKGEFDLAMADINHWLKMRIVGAQGNKTRANLNDYFNNIQYYEYNAPTPKKKMNPEFEWTSTEQENFIHAILQLRRIEFWGEGARWFDVKRYGIAICRRLVPENDPKGVQLLDQMKVGIEERDNRWAVQIPMGVEEAGLTPNPR